MAVEVEMSKDIHDYEPKIIGFMTMRQLVCVAIGLAYAVPLAVFLPISDLTTRLIIASHSSA